MKTGALLLRILITALALAVAGVIAWQLWIYYMVAPWTRDGRVRADTVALAPDVSGPVVRVFVHDNEQVHAGEKLFQIDPTRFKYALAQAEAAVEKAQAAMQNAETNAKRYAAISHNAVTGVARDESTSTAREAKAAYDAAEADLSTAQFNLAEATVRATVNGQVTNFSMRPGDFVSTGKPVLAIVDTDSLYVDGYFEETKLRRIAPGDQASVTLLDGAAPITGHVSGIAAGITDAERSPGSLLAQVNPTFTWVRLAQRVPVRITLDHVPAGVRLVAGMTCTVSIHPAAH
ncbi:MAG: efflux transporter periplasmic adaptor subunit [Rhodospirillales bacterium 20-64-7]|nr:MAG: efflux transporter periplasmic adaptor subunit [Rhodospirillales bacterium 20-64-7]